MRYLIPLTLLASGAVLAQEASSEAKPAEAKKYVIEAGTRIPMTMLNSVSTKHAVEGDRVYLETLFPVLVDGRIVVPAGSSIAGSVTSLKRPGRVKGKGELYVRFDTLILPNGTSRDFRSRLGAIDGRDNQTFDRDEGKIKGESDKSGDAVKIGTATTTGATVGGLAGAIGGRAGMGVGIGAAAGAAAALTGILVTRGPDVVLAKGSTVELLLDRPLAFDEAELDFSNSPNLRRSNDGSGGPIQRKSNNTGALGGRRPPLIP
jgi:type IV secretion system protein VirB10